MLQHTRAVGSSRSVRKFKKKPTQSCGVDYNSVTVKELKTYRKEDKKGA